MAEEQVGAARNGNPRAGQRGLDRRKTPQKLRDSDQPDRSGDASGQSLECDPSFCAMLWPCSGSTGEIASKMCALQLQHINADEVPDRFALVHPPSAIDKLLY